MKMFRIVALMSGVVLGLVAASSFAQVPGTPRVDVREANQDKRIQQGIQSGSLNANEQQRLERGEQHIQNTEARMEQRSGGALNEKQQKRLNRMQNRESRRIFRAKHNRR